jgi:hypothetical protein
VETSHPNFRVEGDDRHHCTLHMVQPMMTFFNRVFEERKSFTFLMKKGSFWEHEHMLSMDHWGDQHNV